MHLADELATDIQLNALRRFGYVSDHALTRAEASHLLTRFQHPLPTEEVGPDGAVKPHTPYHLRKLVEEAREAVRQGLAEGEAALAATLAQRQEFWIDTCREVTQMRLAWPEIITLYRQHGCCFMWPTREQVQEILDALDSALPTWDLEHPELFYQTLELNFPTLVQNRCTAHGMV